MGERRTIAVSIQGRVYRVRTGRDAQRVKRAAALVDETMERLRARTKKQDTVEAVILVALNLAERLLSGSVDAQSARSEHAEALAALSTQIEQTLKPGSARR